MNKDWKQGGTCTETELQNIICGYKYSYYTAWQTDRFLAGKDDPDSLGRIEWNKLLEIRLFTENDELLARRTMIGAANPFQWRIASEDGLDPDEYIVRYQTLDIDTDHIEDGEYGNLRLLTTGGGTYELPINRNENSVKVISYICYDDENGMAGIYDNRLAGFAAKGGK